MPITIQVQKALHAPHRLQCEAHSIGEALEKLRTMAPELSPRFFDESGTLRSSVKVFLNEEDMRYLRGEETTLHDGDTVALLTSMPHRL